MTRLHFYAFMLCCALTIGTAHARYDQIEFFHLIERNDVGSTRKALAEGEFSANTFNQDGFSALYLALREPAPEVADLLIEDPRTKLNLENAWGENALMMAALRGLLPQAIRMMELGAEVNKTGWAPLHYAASSGHLPMIKLLLDNYAYIDAQSPTGETPLMMAAARGTPAAVQMLLDAEADPNIKNKKRQTAIDMAMERSNTDNAKVIRDWLLRGGKPAPKPASIASAKPHSSNNSNNSNALPIGAGSASVNNYGGSDAMPNAMATPTPLPTTAPSQALMPPPTVENQNEAQANVEVQAVPNPNPTPTPHAHSDADSGTTPAAIIDTAPTPAEASPPPSPSAGADIPVEPKPIVITSGAVAIPPPVPVPAAPKSIAEIIAAPASRALLQILSQPQTPPAP
jgi:hypothetical protein